MQNLLKKSLPTLISKISGSGSGVNTFMTPMTLSCKAVFNLSADAKNAGKDTSSA
jgi:hypothetical protein